MHIWRGKWELFNSARSILHVCKFPEKHWLFFVIVMKRELDINFILYKYWVAFMTWVIPFRLIPWPWFRDIPKRYAGIFLVILASSSIIQFVNRTVLLLTPTNRKSNRWFSFRRIYLNSSTFTPHSHVNTKFFIRNLKQKKYQSSVFTLKLD